ncbi:MAG TPA: response regulator transcription factor [Candidatus Synoicihabitans sp.]|nr:response regulator transcription factor [Candidatus Synoicihabitans sp.]
MTISVAIVEDNAGICRELECIIEQAPDLTWLCSCRNGAAALKRIPASRPDVIIMDIQLPDLSGIECTRTLKRQLPDTRILMFTIHDDADQIVRALKAGASGYILKSTEAPAILDAVRDVCEHGAPMSKEVARTLVDTFREPPQQEPKDEELTIREREILSLLSDGLLYKEIADRLMIKLDTVGTHVKNIYRKLHVRSRTEAAMKYRR